MLGGLRHKNTRWHALCFLAQRINNQNRNVKKMTTQQYLQRKCQQKARTKAIVRISEISDDDSNRIGAEIKIYRTD